MNRCDVWIEDKWQPKTTNRTQIAICCPLAIHLLSDQSTFWYRSRPTDLHIHVWINPALSVCCIYPTHQTMKRKGEWKENSDDHTHFFCSTKFFLPSQRQKSITSATITFLINKDWVTSFTQKLKNCYLVKSEYDTCQLIFTKQVLKLFDCLHITVRYHNQRNTALTLHPS